MKGTFNIDSPIGMLCITVEERCVTSIAVADGSICEELPTDEFGQQVKDELERYFAGKAEKFSFPIRMSGTPFQLRVWGELRCIPYGSVATYGIIARRIGAPQAARAVGMACNHNRLLLAVPCHRVVGSGGKMTGFAVGIERKKFLLNLEKQKSRQPFG